jgi:predicted PurR-regulated permease PerM
VGIFLFFLWLISYSRQTLSMLIFAAIIAILAKPISNFFQNRLRFPQGLAIMVTYLLVAALIVIIPLILIPNIADGVNTFVNYDWDSLLGAVSNGLNQASDRVSTIPIVGSSIANTLAGLSQLV